MHLLFDNFTEFLNETIYSLSVPTSDHSECLFYLCFIKLSFGKIKHTEISIFKQFVYRTLSHIKKRLKNEPRAT